MQKRIFISHSWKAANHSDYEGVLKLLNDRRYFNFSNYSVDSENPLLGAVWTGIENRIKNANIVLITAGVYVSYSDSIQKEIMLAKKYNKRIIAIKPHGNTNVSSIVSDDNDIEVVNYNTESIVSAIRR